MDARGVLAHSDLWCVLADFLPLRSRLACSRVCRSWKAAVEDGLDQEVASICCFLADNWRSCRGGERQGRMGQVRGLAMRCAGEWLGLQLKEPETWVKLVLREAMETESWLRRGALRTKISTDPGTCELGWSPLHMAVARGDAKKVRDMIEGGGANMETKCVLGLTPLHQALRAGTPSIEVVKELLPAVGGRHVGRRREAVSASDECSGARIPRGG
mmetsp:Transcript_17433/g.42032  ORF Transcript_17433/g.42032 Transcript_17433/m.42032 type:complete len:216 (-) Transcript_17433:1264-1911(-)